MKVGKKLKLNNLTVESPIEEKTIIYRCPYCSRKFLSKNSYRNHIIKDYCPGYFINFEKKRISYEANEITKKEYYEWCYENGYIEFLDLSEVTIKELGEEFYNKIANLYDEE